MLELHVDVQKLNVRTINNYIQTYASMFGWAKRNSFVTHNHFEGLTVRQGKKRSKYARTAFIESQVQHILTELIENRSASYGWPIRSGATDCALFGARLNEIAQIHLADIRQQDGYGARPE